MTMAPSQGRENVAVFNPIVLALPDWHPDGPDGDVDGYVIPFVFPNDEGTAANRGAKIAVHVTYGADWRAELRNCQTHAATADQARAFAGAWIRAAEVLEAIAGRAAKADDDVVDAEVVDDDEDQDDAPKSGRGPSPVCPACHAGSCTFHDWADAADNPDGSCAGCGAAVDDEHRPDCPVYLARLRRDAR
ncbi:hypothetical protein SEA_FLAGSTAFF_48 [Mycobacterium phage FlagStaff]|uniref:Uncharacterized protein n=1 Tax=Mycobacterium phage FlagStaff TaxID=1647304 RepID=A0A0F6WE25_9CAUD|nr:hypothetical protein AVT49_gp48 [Mycobacterium phage FlagStaff]AKF14485.1 hypothetical protein SEA_FLAGSTAFF_48 [Mycobacterium phage FlagStaff]